MTEISEQTGSARSAYLGVYDYLRDRALTAKRPVDESDRHLAADELAQGTGRESRATHDHTVHTVRGERAEMPQLATGALAAVPEHHVVAVMLRLFARGACDAGEVWVPNIGHEERNEARLSCSQGLGGGVHLVPECLDPLHDAAARVVGHVRTIIEDPRNRLSRNADQGGNVSEARITGCLLPVARHDSIHYRV